MPGRCSGSSAPRWRPPRSTASTQTRSMARSRNASILLPAISKVPAAAAARCARAARGRTRGQRVGWVGVAGFYHSYAGNNQGLLRYIFTGDNRADLAKITEGLGRDWIFLETLYRIYSTAGYNIAHVDVTARLCEEHNLTYDEIDHIEAVVNWLETEYPSPAFPSRREGAEEEHGR